LREITISSVLLDSTVSFFAFLNDSSVKSFVEVRSLRERELNEGINNWFEKRYHGIDNQHYFLIFGHGQAFVRNLINLKKKLHIN